MRKTSFLISLILCSLLILSCSEVLAAEGAWGSIMGGANALVKMLQPITWKTQLEEAKRYENSGDYAKAIELAVKARKMAANERPESIEGRIESSLTMASSYAMSGQLRDAERTLEQALDICNTDRELFSRLRAEVIRSLIAIDLDLKQIKLAKILYPQMIDSLKSAYGPESSELKAEVDFFAKYNLDETVKVEVTSVVAKAEAAAAPVAAKATAPKVKKIVQKPDLHPTFANKKLATKLSKETLQRAVQTLRTRIENQYDDMMKVVSVKIIDIRRMEIKQNWEGADITGIFTVQFTRSSNEILEELRGKENGRHGDVMRILDRQRYFGPWEVGETYKITETLDLNKKFTKDENSWNTVLTQWDHPGSQSIYTDENAVSVNIITR